MDDSELLTLLGKMDIPDWRKKSLNKSNILWLYKNLESRNSSNSKFPVVKKELSRRVFQKIYSS